MSLNARLKRLPMELWPGDIYICGYLFEVNGEYQEKVEFVEFVKNIHMKKSRSAGQTYFKNVSSAAKYSIDIRPKRLYYDSSSDHFLLSYEDCTCNFIGQKVAQSWSDYEDHFFITSLSSAPIGCSKISVHEKLKNLESQKEIVLQSCRAALKGIDAERRRFIRYRLNNYRQNNENQEGET